MTDWLEGMAGPQFATAVVWTLAALILLVIVLVVVRLVRSMTFGTFVAGGRNRKTRLAVMDATAVDSHRRLVLVRRDDIEHLLLIGGPTDVVVERDIRIGQGQARGRQSVFGPRPGRTASSRRSRTCRHFRPCRSRSRRASARQNFRRCRPGPRRRSPPPACAPNAARSSAAAGAPARTRRRAAAPPCPADELAVRRCARPPRRKVEPGTPPAGLHAA